MAHVTYLLIDSPHILCVFCQIENCSWAGTISVGLGYCALSVVLTHDCSLGKRAEVE